MDTAADWWARGVGVIGLLISIASLVISYRKVATRLEILPGMGIPNKHEPGYTGVPYLSRVTIVNHSQHDVEIRAVRISNGGEVRAMYPSPSMQASATWLTIAPRNSVEIAATPADVIYGVLKKVDYIEVITADNKTFRKNMRPQVE